MQKIQHELTQFFHAASINFLWDAVEEYNGTIECSCYSCCAIKFKGADLENPINRDCALRRAFIERLKDNNCVMFNLIGDDEDEHSSRVVYRKASGSPSFNREETFPETDAHIVELYRRPGFNESFENYQKSDNFWQVSGFAKFICGAMTVEDVHVKRWRDLLMHLYDVRESAHMKATYAVVVPLIKILWPEWEHDVE